MLRAYIPQPAVKPAPFTETQAHAADMAYHQQKVADPYGQRRADQAMAREIALRTATGMVA